MALSKAPSVAHVRVDEGSAGQRIDNFLLVTLKGNEISIVKPNSGGPFPQGEIAKGTLFWHVASEQWIIVTSDEDRMATEVGGCSDGPEVVDLKKRIYWTC